MALQGNARNDVPNNDGNNANNNQAPPALVAPANNRDREKPIREHLAPNIDDSDNYQVDDKLESILRMDFAQLCQEMNNASGVSIDKHLEKNPPRMDNNQNH
ncbi:hypothetical protein V6N13_059684 [Hibiscus sabdariffa]